MFCFQIAISIKNSQDLGNWQPKPKYEFNLYKFEKNILITCYVILFHVSPISNEECMKMFITEHDIKLFGYRLCWRNLQEKVLFYSRKNEA